MCRGWEARRDGRKERCCNDWIKKGKRKKTKRKKKREIQRMDKKGREENIQRRGSEKR